MKNLCRFLSLILMLTLTNLTACVSQNAQVPHVGNPDWKHLVENSTLIVVGSVEGTLYVEDPKKLYDKMPTSGGNASNANQILVPLPNLREAIKGILVRFRMEEIIYTDKERNINELVNIYVKDGYAPSTDTNTPIFASGKKYLVFLSPLEEADDVKEAIVIQPLDLSKRSFDFDYKSAFKVTEKNNGYFDLTKSNQRFVDKVRRVVKKIR